MQTLLTLLENMSHSTLPGFLGVSGIFLFLIGLVAASLYRIKNSGSDEEH